MRMNHDDSLRVTLVPVHFGNYLDCGDKIGIIIINNNR